MTLLRVQAPEFRTLEFMDSIYNGEIPLFAPKGSSKGGSNRDIAYIYSQKYWQCRDECITLGMWAIVFHEWVKELAKWIGNRQCLEIMAGAGWLAKALKQLKQLKK